MEGLAKCMTHKCTTESLRPAAGLDSSRIEGLHIISSCSRPKKVSHGSKALWIEPQFCSLRDKGWR